jgi:two-component system, cell cycle sensor histidine kinase and response regulator CckA
LVEDERAVCALTKHILVNAGYTVLAAGSGREALRLCEQHKGPLHLVLTDVIMPEMSGKELAQHLATRRPNLQVLFMSAHTDENIFHEGMLSPETNFIGKPFTPGALTHAIRQLLDKKVARG